MQRLIEQLQSAAVVWSTPKTSTETIRDIRELQERLVDGHLRLAAGPVNLQLAWFPPAIAPSAEDHFAAERGLQSASSAIRDEYFEEVKLFVEAIETLDEHIPLAPWQRPKHAALQDDVFLRVHRDANKRAFAMGNWDRYAIPVRLKGSEVVRIWPSRDVGGEPIARSVPVAMYVALVAQQTARDAARIWQLSVQRQLWAILAIVLLLLHLIR